MTRARHRSALFLALAPALITGCARIDNDRIDLAGERLPAFTPLDSNKLGPASAPSLEAGSRDHWNTEQILVGLDSVQHHITLTTDAPRYSKGPRPQGEFPTADTAPQLASPAGPQIAEGFAAPFHAARDVVHAVPRAIFSAKNGGLVASPLERAQRAPQAVNQGASEQAPAQQPAHPAPEH